MSSRRLLRYIVHAGLASCALVAVAPLLAVAAAGIMLSSPGPIFYRARRIGRDRRRVATGGGPAAHIPERRQDTQYRGREFTLYKLRTMHTGVSAAASPITAVNDARVFPFGALLRATKIDELPQLLNVILGDMALVGPRPEAPEIVRQYYSARDLETLQVLPGLTSPGSLYYYTHCEMALSESNVTELYVEQILPIKLAIDRVYIHKASFVYDVQITLRTGAVLIARLLGRRHFSNPPELADIEVPGCRQGAALPTVSEVHDARRHA
jgi:lipopolysaccharide/colanic/teichoic acid biosynthesis glycosyltransferase